jgi:hypothetical protein
MTILRVSGYSGKNIKSAKLEVFPNVTKRQRQSEIAIFYRRTLGVPGSDACANHSALEILKRKSGAQLDFAAWSHGHGNGAELRGIDEAARRAEIDFVQGVESLSAKLEVESFRNAKRAL